MKLAITAIAAASVLAGCATAPENVAATYVSPAMYSNMSCKQLVAEANAINAEVARVTGKQQKEVTEDALATGVGLVLFWPALFFLMDGDHSAELGNVKGQAQAIQTAYNGKGC